MHDQSTTTPGLKPPEKTPSRLKWEEQQVVHAALMYRMRKTKRELIKRYPCAFVSRAPRPLALGIAKALFERIRDIDRRDIMNALRDYCEQPDYLRALITGAARVNLYGRHVGIVSDGHARNAKMRLARIEKQKEARGSNTSGGDHVG